MSDTSLEPVSVEQDGRILTGVGVSEASIQETMDERPAETTPPNASSEPALPGAAVPTQPPSAASSEPDDKLPFHKRIAKKTYEAEEANRRAEDYRQKLADTEAALASLQRERAAPPTTEQPVTQRVAQAVEDGTLPALPPQLASFDAYVATHPQAQYEDWLDARQLHRTRALLAQEHEQFDAQIRGRIEADRASRTLLDRVAESQARGRQVYQDFDAVLKTQTDPIFPLPMLEWIVRHPQSEHLQYQLAKDPVRAREIAGLLQSDPLLAGARLVALIPAASDAPSASPGAAVTPPPPPYQPVGAGSRTTSPSLEELAVKGGEDFDASGYSAARRASLKGVRGRR